MAVWNEKPTREVLFLGNKIRQFDVIGKSVPTIVENNEQAIEAGPDPKFVVGLHESITRLRMSLAFEHQQVPSVYSKPQANLLRFHNYFPQGAGGSLTIVVPKEGLEAPAGAEPGAAEASLSASEPWTIDPPQGSFKLARGEDAQFPFQIRLKNAMFGRQPIRIDFNVEADEHYQFSAYGAMEVGTRDVTLEVRTHVDEENTLIVEQRMTNLTKNLADFKCDSVCRGGTAAADAGLPARAGRRQEDLSLPQR